MAKTGSLGVYSGSTQIQVTESAANTLTFQRLATGIAPAERIGWVLAKFQMLIGAGEWAKFNSSGDALTIALTVSNQLTALSFNDPAIMDLIEVSRIDLGTAASGLFVHGMIEHDFSTLPGGGLLMLPNPVYLGIKGTGLSAAASCVARLYFQTVEMSDSDYFNLVQSRQILVNS